MNIEIYAITSLRRTFTLPSCHRSRYLAVETALEDNEEEVGRGIASSFVESSEILKAVNERLKNLLDCLDSYLIHWPVAFFLLDYCPIEHTWHAMEKLVKDGKVRSIGVSNFTKEKLKELLRYNIVVTVYSSLGNNIYNIPRVKLAKEPAQVSHQLGCPGGTAVLPKSITASRIESNFHDFVLLPVDDFTKNLDLGEKSTHEFPHVVFGEAGEEEVTKVAKKLAEERVKAKAARKYAWM
ncbi:aldehyde reductase-like protein [Lipomyces doorenjongii]|uniref:aldehyde reductase-like protein n=1 Tax=Lipomyces doorenjongii TaxID=383834 RepID=UPI0034CEDFF6